MYCAWLGFCRISKPDSTANIVPTRFWFLFVNVSMKKVLAIINTQSHCVYRRLALCCTVEIWNFSNDFPGHLSGILHCSTHDAVTSFAACDAIFIRKASIYRKAFAVRGRGVVVTSLCYEVFLLGVKHGSSSEFRIQCLSIHSRYGRDQTRSWAGLTLSNGTLETSLPAVR